MDDHSRRGVAAVRDKNVRRKNGDRSVDTVDTIYWNTDLCKPVSVHKYTST